MKLLAADWAAPPCVRAFTTLRGAGHSGAPYGDGIGGEGLNLADHVGDDHAAVLRNRGLLRAQLPTEPVWLQQTHGVIVCNADTGIDRAADANIATRPGVVCAVLTADCLPVLLCDAGGHCVAAVHAGWRGLAAGVLSHAVSALQAAGAREILAWLGPAIGPREFEVGVDVLQAFGARASEFAGAFEARAQVPGKYLADIYELARIELRRAGVMQITGGKHCTVSEQSRFYSYRRDGVTGRMASVIWIDRD